LRGDDALWQGPQAACLTHERCAFPSATNRKEHDSSLAWLQGHVRARCSTPPAAMFADHPTVTAHCLLSTLPYAAPLPACLRGRGAAELLWTCHCGGRSRRCVSVPGGAAAASVRPTPSVFSSSCIFAYSCGHKQEPQHPRRMSVSWTLHAGINDVQSKCLHSWHPSMWRCGNGGVHYSRRAA
jgi:hypothetical protein